jgi:hypothetical protein
VHGHDGQPDQTELLLMGDAYHIAKFRKDRHEAAAAAAAAAAGSSEEAGGGGSQGSSQSHQSKTIELPPPLALSQDRVMVGCLRDVFTHLGKLQFWDMPDYDLIQRNIRRFGSTEQPFRPPPVPPISYEMSSTSSNADRGRSSLLGFRRHIPRGCFPEDSDSLDKEIFDDVEESSEGKGDDRLDRLPLELRYRMAQMEYHASRPDGVPPALALRDWMKVTIPLLYGEWDTPKYEGRHRTSTDGLKRELYLDLLERSLAWAAAFNNFRSKACFEFKSSNGATKKRSSFVLDNAEDDLRKSKKSRTDASACSFVNVSRALFGLKHAIQAEHAKKSGAQATRITFS